jgi:hypothetical protein
MIVAVYRQHEDNTNRSTSMTARYTYQPRSKASKAILRVSELRAVWQRYRLFADGTVDADMPRRTIDAAVNLPRYLSHSAHAEEVIRDPCSLTRISIQ